jgi:hypothetical protein
MFFDEGDVRYQKKEGFSGDISSLIGALQIVA